MIILITENKEKPRLTVEKITDRILIKERLEN